ncbi:MAG: prefoldin subunit alpha [Candidatus Bathyarchaeia archaeon]
MQSKEDQLRRTIMELRMMENTAETYQERAQLLSNVRNNLRMAKKSLNDLKDVESETPILVPVGGDTFVNAQLGDIEKVIVNVGADVSVEMELENAISDIDERLKEIEEGYEAVQTQLSQILYQMQAHEERANRLSAELRGEPLSV